MARSSQTLSDRKRRLILLVGNRCSTTSILGYRMQLNNYLQLNGGTSRLQYVDVASGPAHKPTWHCTIYGGSEGPGCCACLDPLSRWRPIRRRAWWREG